ncbi:MAG: NAD-dependent epimerase/dehydratase family protein [Chloroflexi bacterium]|nr:NAD-dependent epimerase/dehydratase family protein [Chloroflexota bacterium]MCL5025329.1 NAD-dependent epimerase/dehydratase family protein [Chloroflexota bacterium]
MIEPAYHDFYAGRRVLITGGLGFIGSNLAHRLVSLNARVLLVDSLVPDYGGNPFNVQDIRDAVTINVADIRDQHAMRYLVQGQDIIFNLAGQISHIDSMRDPYTDLEINCRSQLSLLEACRHNNPEAKIIYASTRQVYGKPRYLPVDEEHLAWPTDVNGINKLAGERYHLVYSQVYGLQATSLRLTNTYGPRQLLCHNRQGFIGWFIRQAIDGEEIQLFGDGRQVRDLTYVDDVVEAFLLAGFSDQVNGQIFNLGGLQPISLRDLVELLLKTVGAGSYRLVPFPDEKRAIDIGDFYANYDRIRRVLGWEPRVGIEEGLARTVEFYRAHRQHYWSRCINPLEVP